MTSSTRQLQIEWSVEEHGLGDALVTHIPRGLLRDDFECKMAT